MFGGRIDSKILWVIRIKILRTECSVKNNYDSHMTFKRKSNDLLDHQYLLRYWNNNPFPAECCIQRYTRINSSFRFETKNDTVIPARSKRILQNRTQLLHRKSNLTGLVTRHDAQRPVGSAVSVSKSTAKSFAIVLFCSPLAFPFCRFFKFCMLFERILELSGM